MDLNTAVLLAALAGAVFVYVSFARKANAHRLPYPPGPKGWPVIGNMLDMPQDKPWETYAEWAKTYGPVVHLRMAGKPMIILNTAKAASDLLDARSANYSDRYQPTMVSLIGFAWNPVMMRYGAYWRQHRRLIHKYWNEDAIKTYEPVQMAKARKLLSLLLQDPENFVEHSRFTIGAALLELIYGSPVEDGKHRYLKYAEDVAKTVIEAFLPGNMVVEVLPFLQYMPSWSPGATYKKRLPQWREDVIAMRSYAFEDVKANLASGTARPSLVARMLDEVSHLAGLEYQEQEDIARNSSAVIYAAGADTTYSTLQTFFLAMVLHPDVQRKAQEEMAKAIGPGRLPEFSDRESLPYIFAIIKECTRWIPVVPLGVAHSSMEDDEYEGYLIPKGSVMMPNQWAILHNPDDYPEPEAFNPERFMKDDRLNPDVRDPHTAAFGFGRRICPGRHFSDATLFINIASILHVFDINPPVDEHGKPVYPEVKITSGLVTYPSAFKCIIKPRSPAAERLVHDL
ncbi:CyP450 monooxygenase [Obba rivulosa]|uniref:CyP450 monooxygenase n=1 Tax=Obba rivulosa TaxID=1052685 RepID=A0A8E2AJL3_9APHY|nr:CyP450 monooxygenase [Obba rivulosa]